MDLIDNANATADLFLAADLSRRPTPKAVRYTHCRFCGEKLKTPGGFCDADCRDDFEREQAAEQRNATVA